MAALSLPSGRKHNIAHGQAAAWRWAAAMLGELRAIRKDLDEIAAASEKQDHPR